MLLKRLELQIKKTLRKYGSYNKFVQLLFEDILLYLALIEFCDTHIIMNKRSYDHQRARRANPPKNEAAFFFDFKGDVALVDSVTSQSEEINKTFVISF